MKKIATSSLLIIAVAAIGFAGGQCNPNYQVHGTFKPAKDTGCWTFVTDTGEVLEPINGSSAWYRDGLTGVLQGVVDVEVATSCNKGRVIDACTFDADNQATAVGRLTYDSVEGGCWVLEVGNRTYIPLSDQRAFYNVDSVVKVKGFVRSDVFTKCNTGDTFDVLSWKVVGNPTKSTAGSYDASCHADYAHCRNGCRQVNCIISCEILYQDCLDPQ